MSSANGRNDGTNHREPAHIIASETADRLRPETSEMLAFLAPQRHKSTDQNHNPNKSEVEKLGFPNVSLGDPLKDLPPDEQAKAFLDGYEKAMKSGDQAAIAKWDRRFQDIYHDAEAKGTQYKLMDALESEDTWRSVDFSKETRKDSSGEYLILGFHGKTEGGAGIHDEFIRKTSEPDGSAPPRIDNLNDAWQEKTGEILDDYKEPN